MHWLIWAGISVLAFSSAALFQRLAMKEEASDPVSSAIIFQFLLGLGSSVIALLIGFHWPPSHLWPFLLASSALYATGSVLFFRSIKMIEASEFVILGGFGTLVTLIIAFLFLAERLTALQWIGALLILLAIVVVKYERSSFRYNTGVLFALLCTSCYGLAIVFDGYNLKFYDAISYLPVLSFLPGIILLFAFPKHIPKALADARRINLNLGIYSALYIISAETFYLPIQNGALVSQMTTVGRVSIILTVLLAMIFLKEHSHLGKKLIGAILATVGIALMR